MGKGERAWDRSQLTIRLTGRRKELLAKLAAREQPGCTPGEALDRALHVALMDGSGVGEMGRRIESLEDMLAATDSERRLEVARIEKAVTLLTDRFAQLSALISELSED